MADFIPLENEEWKPVTQFPSRYLISNMGRVWSIYSSCFLSPKRTKTGYLRVSLCENGYREECLIHRLVAVAFIDNPENKPTVNHINENKMDNRVDNLEWATYLEQNIHGTRIARAVAHTDWAERSQKIDYSVIASKHDYLHMNESQKTPVSQYSLEGVFMRNFSGISEAARTLGISAGGICSCVKGVRKTCGGFKWAYQNSG